MSEKDKYDGERYAHLSEADREVLRRSDRINKKCDERIEARRKEKERREDIGEGSKKGGEAGSVPRTYSMGAQPPSLNQPLDRKTKTDPMEIPTPPGGGGKYWDRV
ncbi:hypothetical protein JTB14_003879 [Gonioctena quinquepunctata]|nr:hypothetical protein JTB14_003879 [Gonioctena quinquepunctata]